jgi:hypothetical protein
MEPLAHFYRRIVDLNDSQTGGWGSLYYGVFTKVINDNNYKKVAEVGIGYGTHAKYVLKTTSVDRLYLIDPMQYYPNDGFAEDIMRCQPVIPNNHFNEFHDLIQQELSPWRDRFTWFRTKSLDITNNQIANGELDCVFVDGDHSYEAVKNDIRFWWAKVRVGGRMLGDDYWMPDVARAVDEFAKEYNLVPEFLTADGKDYKIFSFKKESAVAAATATVAPKLTSKGTVPLSLCIPTMDRWDFLRVNIPYYLENPYITEIVITDENGHDAERIRATFNNPKIRVYVNDSCLGPFLNKRKVVSLAANPFVCLMDSDNFAPLSYFDAWAAFLCGNPPAENVIYSPFRTIPQANHEGFDYSMLRGVYITRANYKYYWKLISMARILYNTGNYILSKKILLTTESDPDVKYLETQKGPDVMFQNYSMWKNSNMIMAVVPDMDYHHIVHGGSYYWQNMGIMNTAVFDALYD